MSRTNDEIRNELVQELRDIQSKHTYYLMAAAGASLGFGVQKLDGQTPSQLLYVGIGAMALWILSFAFGCTVITGTRDLVSTNMDLINAMSRKQVHIADAVNRRSQVLYRRIQRRNFYQFTALSLGVILFSAWRVLLIYHR